jgi:predicted N-acyltransferase
MEDRFRKAVKLLRRWIPRFLKFDILFCGLPISIGKHALAVADRLFTQDVLDLLVKEMGEIGREEKIRILCMKEFLEADAALVDPVTRCRFFRCNSLPYMKMKILWKDFESYLSQMRHGYRRHILRSVRKLGEPKPVIHRGLPSADTVTPVLALVGSAACPSGRFYELYLEVMKRAKTRLETLDEAFFENIYRNLKDEMELLAVIRRGQVIAAAMLTIYKGTMTFVLVGLDYSDLDAYDVYFNLI